MTSFKIDDKYNHQVITDGTGTIEEGTITVPVLGIGKWLTPTFTVSDDNALVTVDAVEQHSNISRLSFAVNRIYTVGYQGDQILTTMADGHCAMQPYGRQYAVHANFLTDGNEAVPRIDINTVGGENITSKDYYLDAEIIIDGKDIFPSMTDSVQIKGRGHSSWSNNPDSKNPYRLKFDHKVKPLGLTKGKSWVPDLSIEYEVLNVTDPANYIVTSDKYSLKLSITNNSTYVYDDDITVKLYKNLDGTYGANVQEMSQHLTMYPGTLNIIEFDLDNVINGWDYFAGLHVEWHGRAL